MKKILLVVLSVCACINLCYAHEESPPISASDVSPPVISADTNADLKTLDESNQNQDSVSQTEQNTVPIASTESAQSSSPPKLVAPVVKEQKTVTKKNTKPSPKIDLRAIIFDKNADFSADAKAEGRDMTRTEKLEAEINESLHCDVKPMDSFSRKGILADYLTIHPESGPFSELHLWGAYEGHLNNIWANGNYQNTIYSEDGIFTVLEGTFRKNPKLTFRTMQLYGMDKEGNDFMNDMWGDQYLMYHWSKDDQILVGYSRNAVGLEGGTSPTDLPFIFRSQIAKSYNNTRALGAKAQGFHKMYNYNIGAFSAGRAFKDWFPGPEFVAQFGVKPLGMTNGKYGNLLIGGGIDTGNAEETFTVGSAFLDYEYKRLRATFEYGQADGSNGSTGFSPYKSAGFNGTLAYRITPKFQVLARYDQFDPNKDRANDLRKEYTIGMNYFIKDQTIKLMLDYVFYNVENGTYGSKILLGTQVIF